VVSGLGSGAWDGVEGHTGVCCSGVLQPVQTSPARTTTPLLPGPPCPCMSPAPAPSPAGKGWRDFVHREDELVTVVSGRMEFEIGGDLCTLEPGDEAFIPAGALAGSRWRRLVDTGMGVR